MPIDLRFDADEAPLMIDLYELTMAASYFALGFNQPSCFYLSVRRMPAKRGFLVAAGIDRVLEALEQFRFGPARSNISNRCNCSSLNSSTIFRTALHRRRCARCPRGTIFFATEPILEVRAPLIEAQLIETLVLNQIGMASIVASKAARCVAAARGRRLIDFGLRRSQGADAGLIAARSSYLAGFAGTSNVLAGMRYGIPLYGTMAHSYVMAHEQRARGLRQFRRALPAAEHAAGRYLRHAARSRERGSRRAGMPCRKKASSSRACGSTAATCWS